MSRTGARCQPFGLIRFPGPPAEPDAQLLPLITASGSRMEWIEFGDGSVTLSDLSIDDEIASAPTGLKIAIRNVTMTYATAVAAPWANPSRVARPRRKPLPNVP